MENHEFLQVGEILSVNRKASQLLEVPPDVLVNQNLSSMTNISEIDIIEKLKPCTRSRSPTTVSIKLLNQSCSITTGFLFIPATDSFPAQIILRIQKGQPSSSQFIALNDEVKKQKKLMQLLRHSRDNLEIEVQNRTAELVLALDKAKKNELALLEKGERLSLATESNGVGIWDFNLQTQQFLWDDSMFALHPVARDIFSGTYDDWIISLHPNDQKRVMQEIKDAISGKKSLNTEFRVCWANDEIRHVKAVAKVFYDESGKPMRMLGTNIDITERKQDEERLRKSEELWKFALEGSGDGVWEYNLQTGHNTLSSRVLQMLGLNTTSNTDNLLDDWWTDRLHPESQSITNDAFQAVIEKKTNSCEIEQQVRCEDGNYKWLLTRGMVISHTDDDKPERIVGTISDISSTKQEALVKLKLAASVFSHAREGIIITDASNTIIEVNGTFTEITGYSKHEIIGKNPQFLQARNYRINHAWSRQSFGAGRRLWRSGIWRAGSQGAECRGLGCRAAYAGSRSRCKQDRPRNQRHV